MYFIASNIHCDSIPLAVCTKDCKWNKYNTDTSIHIACQVFTAYVYLYVFILFQSKDNHAEIDK